MSLVLMSIPCFVLRELHPHLIFIFFPARIKPTMYAGTCLSTANPIPEPVWDLEESLHHKYRSSSFPRFVAPRKASLPRLFYSGSDFFKTHPPTPTHTYLHNAANLTRGARCHHPTSIKHRTRHSQQEPTPEGHAQGTGYPCPLACRY